MHQLDSKVQQVMDIGLLPAKLWSVAPSKIVLAVSQAESAASFPDRVMASWSLEQYTQGRIKWTVAHDRSKENEEDDGLVSTASMSEEDVC